MTIDTEYGMFTEAGNELVVACIDRAGKREWPDGTSIAEGIKWVQDEVARDGVSIFAPAIYGDVTDWVCGAGEVYDTAVRESIGDTLVARIAASEPSPVSSPTTAPVSVRIARRACRRTTH